MLPGKPDSLVLDSVSHNQDISIALLEAALEIAITPVACEVIVEPIGRETCCGFAVGFTIIVRWKAGVVRLKKGT